MSTKTNKRQVTYRETVLSEMNDQRWRTTLECHQILGTPKPEQAATIMGKIKIALASEPSHGHKLLRRTGRINNMYEWSVVPRNTNPSLN